MNYSTLSIAPIIFALSLGNTHAGDDYDTDHIFASGDVISADMMNEVFDKIKTISSETRESDFIGSWDIKQTTCLNGGPGNCSSLSMTGMTNDSNGITRSRTDVITFANDGDGTFSFSQTSYASLIRSGAGNSAGSGDFAMINGMGLFKDATHGMGMFDVQLVSPTRINLHIFMSGSGSYNIISLDKRAIPPTNPTAFAVATTNLSNVLTWTDNSSDESGFKVYKKTTVAGAWTLIDAGAGLTVSTNIVTYTDTVSAAGDNWYRVKANHVTNGDSIGSKVIKVTNSN